jgi:hypothetical protein
MQIGVRRVKMGGKNACPGRKNANRGQTNETKECEYIVGHRGSAESVHWFARVRSRLSLRAHVCLGKLDSVQVSQACVRAGYTIPRLRHVLALFQVQRARHGSVAQAFEMPKAASSPQTWLLMSSVS